MADADLPRDPNDPTSETGPDDAPIETGVPNAGAGRLIDIKIETELQDSYLTYAMSTIMDRALPDVRDGLKPSSGASWSR
jgi:DNA gyrase subunit A